MNSFNFHKFPIKSTIIGLFCIAHACGAATLGDIEGTAIAERPLHVSVPVTVDDQQNFKKTCFDVKVVFQDRSVPATFILNNTTNMITITTKDIITDKLVHIYFSSICEQNHTKHYLLTVTNKIEQQNSEQFNKKDGIDKTILNNATSNGSVNSIDQKKTIKENIQQSNGTSISLTSIKKSLESNQLDIENKIQKLTNLITDITFRNAKNEANNLFLDARFDSLEYQVNRTFIYLLSFLGVLILIVFVFISSIIFGKMKFDDVILKERERIAREQKNLKNKINKYKEYIRTREFSKKSKEEEVDFDLNFLDTGIGDLN